MDLLSTALVSPHAPLPLVLVNPQAGRGRAGKFLPTIRAFFEQYKTPMQFVETKSMGELQERAERAIANGCQTLLAMGGDGTAQGLVQAALGHCVRLGILPAGGGNDFAAALGFSTDPLTAARKLLSAVEKRVDIARARMADGQERIYLGGGGIGLDAEAAQYAANHYRRWPGKLRYVASALHAFRWFVPMPVSLEFPGSEAANFGATSLITCVLNTPTYGAGLRFAPRARIDDGLLDATLVEDLKLPQILALLPRLLASGEIRSPRLKRIRCSQIRIIPARECNFHGDGEIFGPAPVEIGVMAHAVTMLVPRQK
jgi:diacylglycerol kinase (ATP)